MPSEAGAGWYALGAYIAYTLLTFTAVGTLVGLAVILLFPDNKQ